MCSAKGRNMRIVILVITLIVLTGCGAGQFAVKEVDNRFSEDKNPLYMAHNNRISSKSVAGGFYMDDKGVYLDPFVSKNRSNGLVTLLGFNIANKTDYTTMLGFGDINQLGLIQEVDFSLSEGQLISLKVNNQEENSSGISYNPIGQYASYSKTETGIAEISKDALEKLALAKHVSCKISGAKHTVIYEEKDIGPEFLDNLRQFYTVYVK